MSERNRKAQQSVQEQTELTRKQQLLQHRDREKHKKLFILLGSLLGLALLFVIIGVVYQFFVVPNSAAAKVGNVTLTAADFQKRARYEKTVLENQLQRYTALQQQFGDSSGGFLEAQISQIQSTLASPFSIANQALDGMIEDVVITNEAAKRGITVSDAEIDQALREEIANGQGLVTEQQAQATATAAVQATATAAAWTPTPVPTVDPSVVITATATAVPTEIPQPPAAVISDTAYTEGLNQLEKAALAPVGMSLADYRKIIGARLLRQKLSTAIGQEQVKDTEEQVRASHILLTVEEPKAPISGTETISDVVASLADAATQALSDTVGVSATQAVSGAVASATQALSETVGVTGTKAVTNAVAAVSNVVTKTVAAATSALSETASITETAGISGTAETGSHGPYSDAKALALAQELRQRILNGEDFATLAELYSDDTGSAVKGGDLGWFGKGMMVAPFEEAAFSLPIGEVSEPVKTDFGYHLIKVTEKDENRPKDSSTLDNERAQAFQTWLTSQTSGAGIERSGDLSALLPTGF